MVENYELPESLNPGSRVQIYFPSELYDQILDTSGRGREPNWKTVARMALVGMKAVASQKEKSAA